MPAHMWAIIKNLYEGDEYVLVDGLGCARVQLAKRHTLGTADSRRDITSNKADQCMLKRMLPHTRRKGLTVNVAESKVVHFNSQSNAQLPVFRYGAEQVVKKDSKCLGVFFARN
eukprot:scaffold32296_cov20-Tisochrysis_lutea.AAC.1